jgi:glycosyltransferase involved in cell wall biosynthesis
VRVLIPTDAFPPICGGSGWSTYELARGLRGRGHEVSIVQPRPGDKAGVREAEFDGFVVRRFGVRVPNIPYLRNYYKSEKLTRALAAYLETVLRSERFDIVHAQHVMTTVASIEAAKNAGVPVVATVRDYWPVCYWSDLLYTRDGLALCPECTAGNMRTCIQPRAGALWPAALPMIPYMRANLAAKRTGLARADAIIAVSHRIAADLRERAPELASTRMDVIPNAVSVAAIREVARVPSRDKHLADQLYAVYVGKLAPNKGTQYLLDVVTRADLDWPLIVVGDGPDRRTMETAARQSGRRVEFMGWQDRDEATRVLAGASLLIFPSRGPESLSRVLIEASALGVPIAAMETGGTRDVIDADVTGLLSNTPEGLADDVRRLRRDEALRRSLGAAARRKVEREFDTTVVVDRIEDLYKDLSAR